jgi:group I intron endonuclease
LQVSAVYKISCSVSGNLYIGSSKDVYRRWILHRCDLRKDRHHAFKLQRAWNKHGEDSFAIEILEAVPDLAELIARERYWLLALRPKYNSSLDPVATNTGKKLGPLSAETKEKIRIAVTGFRHTEENKAKMRGPRKPVRTAMTEAEHAAARQRGNAQKSAALKGRPWTPARREADRLSTNRGGTSLKGRAWSDKRRSANADRKPMSPEDRKRISDAMRILRANNPDWGKKRGLRNPPAA